MEARLVAFFAGYINRVRVGGLTYYRRLNKVYCCLSKRPDCSGHNWEMTPGREKSTGEFTGNRYHSSHMKDVYADLPVWVHALRDSGVTGMTYDNYRQSLNWGYVGTNGDVTDFRHFVASTGRLLLPRYMTMTREDDSFTLLWDDKRDTSAARPDDNLHVIYIRDSLPNALALVPDLLATRARGNATFSLPDTERECYHLYPFFGNVLKDGFSNNEYFSNPG